MKIGLVQNALKILHHNMESGIQSESLLRNIPIEFSKSCFRRYLVETTSVDTEKDKGR